MCLVSLSPFFLSLSLSPLSLYLSRYGFDRERSRQALDAGGGEVGATMEQLLLQVFTERYGPKAVSPDGLQGAPMDECLTQRQEEALALTAIYGDRFTERIANSVWSVSLDLSFLAEKAVKAGGRHNGSAHGANGGIVHIREVCRFYLKGAGCRFGDKCKYKHQMPTKMGGGPPEVVAASQPGFSSFSPPEYELEVRFPKGNRYPFQAPVVAFSTNDESVGAAARLSVTERLFAEALAAARSGEPVVYTLITCCEDESAMMELLSVGHHKYSSPPPVLVVPPPVPAAPAMTKSRSGRSNVPVTQDSKSSTNSNSHQIANNRTTSTSNATSNSRRIEGERELKHATQDSTG